MVDLVKIRKKKAKKQEEEAAAREEASSSGSSGSPGSSGSSAEPVTTPDPPRNPEEPRNSEEPPRTPEDPSTPALDKLARFKAEAGKRRGDMTGQIAAVEAVAAQLELLTYVVAGEHYAVDIERIVEIVTPRPVTRVPNADPSIVGIISLRGTIVTLVDVRRRLHHPPAGEATADTRIVVVDYHNETVGFLVDRVLRVVKTAPGEVEPPPIVHASELDESVRGVFRANGALTILLDLDKLLDSRALAATVA